MLDALVRSRPKGLAPRTIYAPHHTVADYDVESARAVAHRLLEHQHERWASTTLIRPPTSGHAEGAPPPRKPRLVSSAHGAIERMLLTYPGTDGLVPFREKLYTRLIKSLPNTFFVVLTQPSVVKEVRAILEAGGAADRHQIVVGPEYLNFQIWAEDSFHSATDVANPDGPNFLLKPYSFHRFGDELVADLVADGVTARHTQLPLMTQGGNTLVADDFVLVGVDSFSATVQLIGRPNDQVALVSKKEKPEHLTHRLFRTLFDATREMIFVGTHLKVSPTVTISDGKYEQELFGAAGVAQPIFHIDMFITLGGRVKSGKYRVVVGSPRMADEILERPPVPYALDPLFDDIAARLARHPRLEVVRSPLPMEAFLETGGTSVWYYATTNNCLVEIIDDDNKTVWLPEYGFGKCKHLKAVDDFHVKMWESWGFRAVRLGDYTPLVQEFGSVHCIKKYLFRG